MDFLSNKKIVLILILALIITTILIFITRISIKPPSPQLKQSFSETNNTNINNQDVTSTKVTYNADLIPDEGIKNTVKNIKVISVKLTTYKEFTSDFPNQFSEDIGNYEYNIVFNQDRIDISLGVDGKLFQNSEVLKKIITKLIIASAVEKRDKNLTSGSLFDQSIRDDFNKYFDTVLNYDKINQISIVELN